MNKNRKIGDLGEDIATIFLKKIGFRIITRNYLKPWGELDIVAEKWGGIRFVEVKTVSCEISDNHVSRETYLHTFRPEENVTREKLKRLNRAIQTFLSERKIDKNTPYQIDVVAVFLDRTSKKAQCDLLEGVW